MSQECGFFFCGGGGSGGEANNKRTAFSLASGPKGLASRKTWVAIKP